MQRAHAAGAVLARGAPAQTRMENLRPSRPAGARSSYNGRPPRRAARARSRSAPATSNTTVINRTTVVAAPSPFGFGMPFFGGWGFGPTFIMPFPFFGGLIQIMFLLLIVNVVFGIVKVRLDSGGLDRGVRRARLGVWAWRPSGPRAAGRRARPAAGGGSARTDAAAGAARSAAGGAGRCGRRAPGGARPARRPRPSWARSTSLLSPGRPFPTPPRRRQTPASLRRTNECAILAGRRQRRQLGRQEEGRRRLGLAVSAVSAVRAARAAAPAAAAARRLLPVTGAAPAAPRRPRGGALWMTSRRHAAAACVFKRRGRLSAAPRSRVPKPCGGAATAPRPPPPAARADSYGRGPRVVSVIVACFGVTPPRGAETRATPPCKTVLIPAGPLLPFTAAKVPWRELWVTCAAGVKISWLLSKESSALSLIGAGTNARSAAHPIAGPFHCRAHAQLAGARVCSWGQVAVCAINPGCATRCAPGACRELAADIGAVMGSPACGVAASNALRPRVRWCGCVHQPHTCTCVFVHAYQCAAVQEHQALPLASGIQAARAWGRQPMRMRGWAGGLRLRNRPQQCKRLSARPHARVQGAGADWQKVWRHNSLDRVIMSWQRPSRNAATAVGGNGCRGSGGCGRA